jgi:outer membrane receptor for ferrienterochelin and colicins
MFTAQRITVAAATVLLTSGTAVAQQDSIRTRPVLLDPVVVTAERRPAQASDVVQLTRVIEAASLARRGVPDLTVVLREVPGLQVDPVVGSGAGITIQGLGSDRVLVLVDGAPLVGRLGGEFDLTRLDPAQFERIEVVEGPQSTLYGSAALGGVINLLTRRDLGSRGELTAIVGSRGQRDGRARLSGTVGPARGALQVGRRLLDLAPGRLPDSVGSARRTDAMARVAIPLGAGSLDIRALGVQDAQRYPRGAAFNFNDNWQLDALAEAAFGPSGATALRMHASTYDHRLVSSTSPAERVGPPDWDRQRLGDVELLHRGRVGVHQWLAGSRIEREWLTSDRITGGEQAAWAGAAYASADWRVGSRVKLGTGARLTASETWGADLAPQVGATVKLPAGLYAKLGVARGFRAPSFKELYFDFLSVAPQFSYAVRGNTTLVPEESWNGTGELGVLIKNARVYARGFTNRLRNFIETAATGDSSGIAIFEYRNVGRARTGGVEAGSELVLGPAAIGGSYALLVTTDEDTGEPLLGRTRNQARASLAVTPGRLGAWAELVVMGRTPTGAAPDGSLRYQEGFARVNLSAGYQLRDAARLTLGVDNLTNKIPAGALVAYERRWFGGLTWGVTW